MFKRRKKKTINIGNTTFYTSDVFLARTITIPNITDMMNVCKDSTWYCFVVEQGGFYYDVVTNERLMTIQECKNKNFNELYIEKLIPYKELIQDSAKQVTLKTLYKYARRKNILYGLSLLDDDEQMY